MAKIDFGRLTEEETKELVLEAFNELTPEDIMDLVLQTLSDADKQELLVRLEKEEE